MSHKDQVKIIFRFDISTCTGFVMCGEQAVPVEILGFIPIKMITEAGKLFNVRPSTLLDAYVVERAKLIPEGYPISEVKWGDTLQKRIEKVCNTTRAKNLVLIEEYGKAS